MKQYTIRRVPDYIDQIDPQRAKAAFGDMGASHALSENDSAKHPFMHKTKTLDYAIVLSGEIYLVLDEDEALMKAGDICIQRATNHVWSNRSNKSCQTLSGPFIPHSSRF